MQRNNYNNQHSSRRRHGSGSNNWRNKYNGASVLGRFRSFVENVADAFDNPTLTTKDRLLDHWTRIQEYYTPQNQDDLRKLSVTDTTIPHHLEGILKLLAQEMLETAAKDAPMQVEQLGQTLEFGPCVEYMLQYHVLTDLVDFAEADLPRGIRKYVLRFFGIFIECIPLGLLPESAIRLPLVAVMRQSLHVIQTSPTTQISPTRRQENADSAQNAFRLGRGFHSIANDKQVVILCHDLLWLVVTLFARLREHANMVQLFFDWGAPEQKTARGSELAVSSLRSASSAYMEQSARGHEMLMMHVIVEYLLAPGMTGQLAREALVLAVQVLVAPQDPGRYVDFLLDHARIVELLVEHLGYLHSQMPVYKPMHRSADARLFRSAYTGARTLAPAQRRMGAPGDFTAFDFRPHLKDLVSSDGFLKSVAQHDQRESTILHSARRILEHVDAFFICWELLDEVAVVGQRSERLIGAVQSQLSNGFLRTHIEPALVANMASTSQANTTVSYLTDLINITHSTHVLDAVFAVILGGDLGPERAPAAVVQAKSVLSADDQALLDSIEDEALRAEAAALLMPMDAAADVGQQAGTLRATLISWMLDSGPGTLGLNTLRLFDSILSSMNQFAYTNLALRNFMDEPIAQDGSGDIEMADDNEPLASFLAPTSFYTGPALGLGESVAVDQELVRAVVERYLDAAPSNVASAMPELVVGAALRIDHENAESADVTQQLEAPRNFQNMRSIIMRESHGCDNYVADCLKRIAFTRTYVKRCWVSKRAFVDRHTSRSSRSRSTSVVEDATQRSADAELATFYPGAFLTALVRQLPLVVKRHMAYNLMLTSIVNKLACIGDPGLCAYLFLANSATVPKIDYSDSPRTHAMFLYDAFVSASADAYVKSERVPRFSARLARQHREGVETAIRVGAAARSAPELPAEKLQALAAHRAVKTQQPQQPHQPHQPHQPQEPSRDSSSEDQDNMPLTQLMSAANKESLKTVARFLGTPVKRFVHGYIVLDEFGKEMAATALALHTVELERSMDRVMTSRSAARADDEYADLLDYYDPREPAYRHAVAVKESLRLRDAVIDLSKGAQALREKAK